MSAVDSRAAMLEAIEHVEIAAAHLRQKAREYYQRRPSRSYSRTTLDAMGLAARREAESLSTVINAAHGMIAVVDTLYPSGAPEHEWSPDTLEKIARDVEQAGLTPRRAA